MIEFPLSKRQKKELKELKKIIEANPNELSNANYDRYKLYIELMKEWGYFPKIPVGTVNGSINMKFNPNGSLKNIDDFWIEIEERDKEAIKREKKEKRNRWALAIVPTIVSAIVSVFTTLLTLKFQGVL